MIRITNGKNQLIVSQGAYKTMYKSLGYEPLVNPGEENSPNPDNTPSHIGPGSEGEPGPSGDSGEDQDYPTPQQVHKMNTSQLMELAGSLGLDTSEVASKSQLMELVLEYIH